MAIQYQLAELVQKTFNTDVSIRRQSLLRARGHYERFLKLLDSYDVLCKADAKLFETYAEDKDNFSTASTRDAAARRDAKITRFREEKELKRKLEVRCALDVAFLDGSRAKARDTVPATEPQACGAG
jgi:immunoglobulin-binding protein 1